MKVLVVSNLYPPHYKGGYEVRCAQVAEALQAAGHRVVVLTSRWGLTRRGRGAAGGGREERGGVPVHRTLYQCAYGPQTRGRPWHVFQARRELADARVFRTLLAEFRPDVVSWWNMNGLSKLLLPMPARGGIPDVHWIEHPWMIDEYGIRGEKADRFWRELWDGAWGPRLLRPLLARGCGWWERRVTREGLPARDLAAQPSHVCFVSQYLRDAYRERGLEFPSAEVLYGGVPVARFYTPGRGRRDATEALRVLYAGQVTADRGLHTVVEALGLMDAATRSHIRLTIAGDGVPSYLESVERRIDELGLSGIVSRLGKVDHERMPQVYAQQDVLVFPSTRPEGLPLVMVEAMLAGCAVLTTGSGGAMEIAVRAGLPLIDRDDPVGLSRRLGALIQDRAELSRIARRGQEVALEEFGFDRMMERWSATLEGLCRAGGAQGSTGRATSESAAETVPVLGE